MEEGGGCEVAGIALTHHMANMRRKACVHRRASGRRETCVHRFPVCTTGPVCAAKLQAPQGVRKHSAIAGPGKSHRSPCVRHTGGKGGGKGLETQFPARACDALSRAHLWGAARGDDSE